LQLQKALGQKINWMETMFIKTSRKTQIEMAWPSRGGFKEDESEKLQRGSVKIEDCGTKS
jgi:hypothetical protein